MCFIYTLQHYISRWTQNPNVLFLKYFLPNSKENIDWDWGEKNQRKWTGSLQKETISLLCQFSCKYLKRWGGFEVDFLSIHSFIYSLSVCLYLYLYPYICLCLSMSLSLKLNISYLCKHFFFYHGKRMSWIINLIIMLKLYLHKLVWIQCC